ncbi:MAG: hypothetical protein AAGA72_10980 [Pseudomonadota bacterium]
MRSHHFAGKFRPRDIVRLLRLLLGLPVLEGEKHRVGKISATAMIWLS